MNLLNLFFAWSEILREERLTGRETFTAIFDAMAASAGEDNVYGLRLVGPVEVE